MVSKIPMIKLSLVHGLAIYQRYLSIIMARLALETPSLWARFMLAILMC